MAHTPKDRKYFAKADLIIIAAVMLMASGYIAYMLFSSFSSYSGAVAEIRVNSELVHSIKLSDVEKPYILEIQEKPGVKIYISSEEVYFTDSPCPDKLCMHTGHLKAGQSAVCLPQGVSVSVISKTSDTPDTIAR